jgi:hypothetical protein
MGGCGLFYIFSTKPETFTEAQFHRVSTDGVYFENLDAFSSAPFEALVVERCESLQIAYTGRCWLILEFIFTHGYIKLGDAGLSSWLRIADGLVMVQPAQHERIKPVAMASKINSAAINHPTAQKRRAWRLRWLRVRRISSVR